MPLTSLQEIELAIDALPPEEQEELSQWLESRFALAADVKLQADVEAGRFDDQITRAIADYKAGKTRPL